MNTTSKNKKLFFSTTLNRKRAFSVYIISALVMLLFLQCINSQQITDKRTRWLTDVDGNPMIMFPNSVLKVGDTFYMYGEWCFEDENSGKNVLKCYSSKDLTSWKFEANVLTQEESHLINRGRMIYNPKTNQYVYCYKYRRPMHFEGWAVGDGILAWATCSSPTGRFKVANKDPRTGIIAGEGSLFRDDDGRVYLVADGTFIKEEGKLINVYELSSDYCSIVKRVCDLGTGHEAISIIKHNNKYWAFGSGLNDWYSSPTSYRSADNIAGPWTPWEVVPTDPQSPDAYKTQDGALIFEVKGSESSFLIWTGVRYWDIMLKNHSSTRDSSAPASTLPSHLWLPLQWKDGKPLLKYYDKWYIDTDKGTWETEK